MAAGPVAQIIELLGVQKGRPISMKVDTGADILKGTLMKVVDPREAMAQSAAADAFIGIAAEEKSSSIDSAKNRITVYTHGIFSIQAGAAITAGERVGPGAEANKVIKVDAANILKSTVGVALETAAGDGEAIAVLVGGMGY